MINQDLVIDEKTGWYNRSFCHERGLASEMIQKLYGGGSTMIFSSGMNAIYMILQSALEHQSTRIKEGEKLTFLYSNEMYTDSRNKVIKLLKSQFSDRFKFVMFKYQKKASFANILRSERDSLGLIFMEAVSNPSSYMVDFELLRNVGRECYIVIDNTWMTPITCNPFKWNVNVDCVVDSCSKYLSAGKCISGHLTFDNAEDPINKRVHNMIRIMGLHVSPIHCKMIQSGIRSLEKVVEIISRRSAMVVNLLRSGQLPQVTKIMHPMVENHPSHDLYKKYITNFEKYPMPGVIWFFTKIRKEILNDKQNWKIVLGEIVSKNGIRYATSFGKPYYVIDMWPKKEKNGAWLRLSIGYGDDKSEEEVKKSICNIVKDLN